MRREIHPLSRLDPPTTVEVLETGGLHRVLALSGALSATIELDLRMEGRQTLHVNGRVVRRASSLLGYGTVFQFDLMSRRGRVPASLEMDANLWQAIRALRLRIRGHVLYQEGVFPGEEAPRHSLPIPATDVAAVRAGLPTPAYPPVSAPELLPLAAQGAAHSLLPAVRRQRRQRAATLASLCLLVGALAGGTVFIMQAQERQLHGPTSQVRPAGEGTSRPRHRSGPFRPAADPTPFRIQGR